MVSGTFWLTIASRKCSSQYSHVIRENLIQLTEWTAMSPPTPGRRASQRNARTDEPMIRICTTISTRPLLPALPVQVSIIPPNLPILATNWPPPVVPTPTPNVPLGIIMRYQVKSRRHLCEYWGQQITYMFPTRTFPPASLRSTCEPTSRKYENILVRTANKLPPIQYRWGFLSPKTRLT